MAPADNLKSYSDVEAVDLLHQVSSFYTSTKVPHDYGTGERHTSTEVYLLKYIADHPNITLTELAYDWGKTKGAISQLLKKLLAKGLIERSGSLGPDNRQPVRITEKGRELNRIHIAYDTMHFAESMDRVRERFDEHDINTAFTVLEYWLGVRREVQRERAERQRTERPVP